MDAKKDAPKPTQSAQAVDYKLEELEGLLIQLLELVRELRELVRDPEQPVNGTPDFFTGP